MAVSVYKWLMISLFLVCCSGCFNQKLLNFQRLRASSHPYYISVVEINHNPTDKTLEISCKIFTDDFEATLEKNYKTKVDLVNPPDKSAMDKLVKDYIKKHLSVKADNKACKSFICRF